MKSSFTLCVALALFFLSGHAQAEEDQPSTWIAKLTSKDAAVRAEATIRVGKMGEAEIPALVNGLVQDPG